MIVKDIKQALLKYGLLSASEIAQITGTAVSDILPLLNEMIAKGRIAMKIEKPFCSFSSCGCSDNKKLTCAEEIKKYFWKD